MKQRSAIIITALLCLSAVSAVTPRVMGWASSIPQPLHEYMAYDALRESGWSIWDASQIAFNAWGGTTVFPFEEYTDYYHRVEIYQIELHEWHVALGEECECAEQGLYGGAEDGAYHYVQLAHLFYASGNKAEALKNLGYAVHFIQDSVCPPHVFPFSEHLTHTAHAAFEAYTAEMYDTIFNDWKSRVQNAVEEPIESAEDLRQKVADAADEVRSKFEPPHVGFGYRRQDGATIGDLSGTPFGWKMSSADIGWCMERAASLVKGAATYVRHAHNLDIIFSIDVTGSMWDDIAAVKASASEIVEAIHSEVTGCRIAVVSYRDFPVWPYGSPGDWPYKDVLGFSGDKTAIIAAIQSLYVGGGANWPESVYSALMHCIDSSSLGGWRTGADKFIILMGDAPPHDPEPFTGYTLSTVATAAEEADPVSIYPIAIGPDSTTYTYFSWLAEATDGKVFTAETASEVPEAIIEAIEEIIDNFPPEINVITPAPTSPPQALQDGVTLEAAVTDPSGVDWVTFSIREPNGDQGIVIDPMFESMPATNTIDDQWVLNFDTTQLPDGYYLLLVEASDTLGNEGYVTVEFSIRNWAVVELLPASESNKARRTMPVKFSLRVAEAVDPAKPFVYNEELTIIVRRKDTGEVLQTSTYGDTSTDYRINPVNELYITNFKTLKTPLTYVVEVYRKDMLLDSFEFSTVK